MGRGIPPRSSYLGSDLPDEELMDRGGDNQPNLNPRMAPAAAPPPPTAMQGEAADWQSVLAPLAEQAGVDPNILMQGPGEIPSEFLEAIKPLQGQLGTDSEVSAFETMLDEYGLLGQLVGEGDYGGRDSGPNARSAGKPGMSFTPDRPGRY